MSYAVKLHLSFTIIFVTHNRQEYSNLHIRCAKFVPNQTGELYV